MTRLPKTRAAMAYAAERHAGQLRKADRAPFIEHALEVGWLLYRVGACDDVIAAGVLHDTIEKSDADGDDLRARFGTRVADLVLAVSEDPDIQGYAKRKAALRDKVANAGPDALMVFAADKVSKVRELRMVKRISQRRLMHYRHCVELLEQRLSGCPLVLELRAEFDQVAVPAFA